MDKDPGTKLGRSQQGRKRIQNRIAELEQANESLKADLARHKRTEDELNLLLRIAREIGSANDFVTSVDVGLRTICQSTGWACGEVWVPSPDGTVLECRHACCREFESLQRFNELSRDFRFFRDQGLPGRVWASKQPEWVQDVSTGPEDQFLRRGLAKDFGLRSALGVPILANDQLLAVLVFFMSESREKDERLIEIVSSAAAQLGMTLQHIQYDQTLRDHRSLLQAIMDNSTSIIWFKDRQGRFQFINREFEQRFRVRREDVQGKTDHDLFPGSIAQEFRANDLKVIEAGVPMNFEECAPQESSVHTYISNKFPVRDEDGKVYAVCGIATDITERKLEERSLELRVEAKAAELLEASKFNQAVMASMSEGLYTIDAQGLVTYINPAAERLFGWSSAELLGRKMHDVTHYQYPDGRAHGEEQVVEPLVVGEGPGRLGFGERHALGEVTQRLPDRIGDGLVHCSASVSGEGPFCQRGQGFTQVARVGHFGYCSGLHGPRLSPHAAVRWHGVLRLAAPARGPLDTG